MSDRQIFIVSAPSGTGKTTLVKRLALTVPGVVISRSYTSRSPSPKERDGVDYNFIDEARFASMVKAGAFLEWANVFGYSYGTCVADTESLRCGDERLGQPGCDVVLVIDVQGSEQVRRSGVSAVRIFIVPPSLKVLEQRLRDRSGTHADEQEIRNRLEAARGEIAAGNDYDYVIVNDDVENCLDELRSIVIAERLKRGWRSGGSTVIADLFRSP